jgi:hypothetical protein
MTAAERREIRALRRRLIDLLTEPDGILPGTIVERTLRCGKQNCRCKAEPPQLHGPYTQWGYSHRGSNKVTRWLSADQLERHRTQIDRGARLKELLAALEAAEIRLVERAEGWGA